jgi:hypothetical protein
MNMAMYRQETQWNLNPFRDLYVFETTITFHNNILPLLIQVSVFTSFASTGDPNSNIINADMENVEWKAIDTKQPPFKCLNFDEHLKFDYLPEAQRLAMWDELYNATNTPLY